MTAPERIWIDQTMNGYVAMDFGPPKFLKWPEYILHTRAALASSPLVQEIVTEAFRAGFMRSGEGWCDANARPLRIRCSCRAAQSFASVLVGSTLDLRTPFSATSARHALPCRRIDAMRKPCVGCA